MIVELTPAQFRVYQEFMRYGARNGDLARNLDLDINTVKSHMKAIFRAAGAHSRTELAFMELRGEIEIVVVVPAWS